MQLADRTLLLKNRRKRLACDVFDTCVTHVGLAHDVTDTDVSAENGTTHRTVFKTFKRRFLTPGNRKLSEKLLCRNP